MSNIVDKRDHQRLKGGPIIIGLNQPVIIGTTF